jgi:hypothetical protein
VSSSEEVFRGEAVEEIIDVICFILLQNRLQSALKRQDLERGHLKKVTNSMNAHVGIMYSDEGLG